MGWSKEGSVRKSFWVLKIIGVPAPPLRKTQSLSRRQYSLRVNLVSENEPHRKPSFREWPSRQLVHRGRGNPASTRRKYLQRCSERNSTENHPGELRKWVMQTALLCH